jgi:hypothetical protein
MYMQLQLSISIQAHVSSHGFQSLHASTGYSTVSSYCGSSSLSRVFLPPLMLDLFSNSQEECEFYNADGWYTLQSHQCLPYEYTRQLDATSDYHEESNCYMHQMH